ncbi:MAG: hypothetical protein ACOYIG_07730 [Acetivibrionales bacterium]|jgi:hypothetical protein|nr:hypothetical protein [Clostridiaceae bacterium]
METIVCDIVKNRMERDFNEALKILGLFVSELRFENSVGMSVVLELSVDEGDSNCA